MDMELVEEYKGIKIVKEGERFLIIDGIRLLHEEHDIEDCKEYIDVLRENNFIS